MVTIGRTLTVQDLVGGLSGLLGSDFSAPELAAIAATLPESVYLELVGHQVDGPRIPSPILSKAVLDALVRTGIFAAKFGSPTIKDEYDAVSRESVDELYALTAASHTRREELFPTTE